jgi:serine-type D-Ala-D-Ala carboxypeptidase (penicillin-binding protein 5/6)
MKKSIIITTIFVVIALLHIMFARLIFSDKNPEKPGAGTDAQAPDEPVAHIPSRIDLKKKPTLKKPAVKQLFKKARALPGTPLNYKYAVQGNIPGLSGSKEAKSGILINVATRKVIWGKNPQKAVAIASMTKMMTLLLAMEDIKSGKVTLKTPIKVTIAAHKVGGTQVFLDPRETFTLGELLQSMVLRSANDSAYLVAEFLGNGNIATFIARMNKRAKELNMPAANFINPNGLPGKTRRDNSVSSPEGLALLGEQLLEYPQVMKWSSTKTAIFRPRTNKSYQLMTNTNKLVGTCPGVDGLKTGFTNAAGSCITVSCLRGGKRVIAVVTGFKSWRTRNEFVKKLLAWGYKKDAKLTGK